MTDEENAIIRRKFIEIWDSVTTNYNKQQWSEFDALLTAILYCPRELFDERKFKEILALVFEIDQKRANNLSFDAAVLIIELKMMSLIKVSSSRFSDSWDYIIVGLFEKIRCIKKDHHKGDL